MPYVTSIERRGIERGRQEGRNEGMQAGEAVTLLKILRKRFGDVPEAIEKQVKAASVEQLEVWIDASLDASNLDDIFA